MLTCDICGELNVDRVSSVYYLNACRSCAFQIWERLENPHESWSDFIRVRLGGVLFLRGYPEYEKAIADVKSAYGSCPQCGYVHGIPQIQ
jgi:hypothetical protein